MRPSAGFNSQTALAAGHTVIHFRLPCRMRKNKLAGQAVPREPVSASPAASSTGHQVREQRGRASREPGSLRELHPPIPSGTGSRRIHHRAANDANAEVVEARPQRRLCTRWRKNANKSRAEAQVGPINIALEANARYAPQWSRTLGGRQANAVAAHGRSARMPVDAGTCMGDNRVFGSQKWKFRVKVGKAQPFAFRKEQQRSHFTASH